MQHKNNLHLLILSAAITVVLLYAAMTADTGLINYLLSTFNQRKFCFIICTLSVKQVRRINTSFCCTINKQQICLGDVSRLLVCCLQKIACLYNISHKEYLTNCMKTCCSQSQLIY